MPALALPPLIRSSHLLWSTILDRHHDLLALFRGAGGPGDVLLSAEEKDRKDAAGRVAGDPQ